MPDYNKIFDSMKESVLWNGIQAAVDEFNLPPDEGGFDWKFWDEDNDPHQGWASEVKNNVRLALNVVDAVAEGVDNIADEYSELENDEAKIETASAFIASFFDIPWVPEAVEQMLVKHIIAAAFERLN